MFIVNLPPKKVWVRKEYLRDLRDGYGEYVLGYWVSLKSIWGRSFYFETYMPEYGAMFDKLPISAFLEWDSDHPEEPDPDNFILEPDLPLSDLQYWDSFDYDTQVIDKQFLHSMSVKVRTRSGNIIEGGKYVFTIDSCHRDLDRPDLSYSEVPEEHKSHNCIILPSGQYGLYPNNRCQWFDESLTPSEVKTPDFLVSTRPFSVENGGPNGRLGDAEEYFWDYTNPEDDTLLDEAEEGAFGALKDANGVKLDGQQIWNPGPEITFSEQEALVKKDYQGPLYVGHKPAKQPDELQTKEN